VNPDPERVFQHHNGVMIRDVVLLVDDHDGFRAVARSLLETLGFAVAEAATGSEATTVAAALHPTLVLLDIHLPDTTGFDVAVHLAALPDRPTIVLMSTHDSTDFGDRIAASPAVGFLAKEEFSGAAITCFLARDGTE
jgi:CheY-like chemotaxis protein